MLLFTCKIINWNQNREYLKDLRQIEIINVFEVRINAYAYVIYTGKEVYN